MQPPRLALPPATPPLWTVDAGNTAIKFVHFAGGIAGLRLVLPRGDATTNAAAAWSELQRQAGEAPPPVGVAAAVGSTRGADRELIEAILARLAPGARPRWVQHGAALPLVYEYTSGAPGPDRLANAMALRVLFPGVACVAIDLGTATSMVAVGATGRFRGGAILPGLGTQARLLHESTAGTLPLIDPATAPAPDPLANSTIGAMAAGLMLGHAGAVDRLLEDACQANGRAAVRVITGGWAGALIPHLRSDVVHAPGLTSFGLACFLVPALHGAGCPCCNLPMNSGVAAFQEKLRRQAERQENP